MNKLRIAVVVVILAVIAALLGVGSMSQANADAGDPGSSADNPIVVGSLDEIPAEAALSAVLNEDCSTTTTGVLTVPGSDETSHEEFRYSRDVPAVEEVSHLVYSYERLVPDVITQYHFRKFTQERTRTYTRGVDAVDHWWNWSPNDSQGPQDYVPGFPTDSGPDGRPRGTWQGPHVNGGPMQDTFGTFQTGGGNSPFFHREHISDAVEGGWGPWSAYGPWTAWVPETHTSWENSDAPLGVPQFHGSGQNGNTQWERQWQAQFDGQTREFEVGSHFEFSGEVLEQLGGLWVLLQGYPRVEIDQQAVEGYTEYYVLGGEPSLNEDDATWLLAEQAPAEGWTQFDERTVSNEDGTDPVTTYYSFNDGVECDKPDVPEEPEEPKNPPVKHNPPAVPVSIDAGL